MRKDVYYCIAVLFWSSRCFNLFMVISLLLPWLHTCSCIPLYA